jgi:anti-sigma B factor antagonist
MTIEKTTENDSVTLAVSGELTAITADQLTTAIEGITGDTNRLILDFTDLEYVASAGLRVLLRTKKTLNAKGGKFFIRNASEEVMQVFEITGFSNMLDFL